MFERMKRYQASALEEAVSVYSEKVQRYESQVMRRLCSPQEPSLDDHVLLRKRRMTQVEKNTCQLFIQTDHLFYKYYKSREAVIAQVRADRPERWTSDADADADADDALCSRADLQSRQGHRCHLSGHGLHGHPQHQLHGQEDTGDFIFNNCMCRDRTHRYYSSTLIVIISPY